MSSYIGRFAPTPSGPLHLGSLLTAVGSYLSARSTGGRWLLRIDNLDTPRIQPGSESEILRQLEAHGLHWDGAPRRQSEHLDEYAAALEQLRRAGAIYACVCSRAQLKASSARSADEYVYSGRCRESGHADRGAALRVKVGDSAMRIDDPLRGLLRCEIAQDIGDFVVRRKDGQFGYQLACAVDEAAQGITDVVRGADLIASSFRQAWLSDRLALPRLRHAHLPLLVDAQGHKLSKQHGAPAITKEFAPARLSHVLTLLGQPLPEDTTTMRVSEILAWAIRHWHPARVPLGPLKVA